MRICAYIHYLRREQWKPPPLQARDERISLGAKIGSLREDLGSLWAMLGKRDALSVVREAASAKPLRAQVGFS